MSSITNNSNDNWDKEACLCHQKIQKQCISQVINRLVKKVGRKGYELETSKFLFLSSFCSASKITLFYVAKIMILL